jgi:hypothetical protein
VSSFTQLSGGTDVAACSTTMSGDGLKRFLSQSAASVRETGAVASAAARARCTLSVKARIADGSMASRRARTGADRIGGMNSCFSNDARTCARTSSGFTGWLNRSTMTGAASNRPAGRYQFVCSSCAVGV